ncbi:MAG TPA: DUF4240 domain-containing protein, partial [Polyangiaceae bacterium]|nr:DUF4240 domain-containing protein [Polyangiaceae bacterium]
MTTRDDFWTLLEASRDPGGDTFETAENLREALERRSLAEVNTWVAELGRVLEESYTLPLRGAL